MILGFLLVLHLLGAFLWVGGVTAAAMMSRRRRGVDDASLGPWDLLERDFLFKLGFPGMVLVLLTGVGLLSSSPEYFLRQGWLHAKLACAAFLVVLSVLLALARRGSAPARTALLQGLFICGVCAVLFLAVIKPF